MRSPVRGRGPVLPADDYWDHPRAVRSMPVGVGAQPYETEGLARAVLRAGGPAMVRRIHVVGVGAGRELPAVIEAAPGATVEAWDISTRMVDEARVFASGRPDLATVVVSVGDIGAGAPLGPPADLVVATNAVLGYVRPHQRRRDAFGAMATMLRPGGALLAVVQQRNGRPDWAVWFGMQAVLTRVKIGEGEPGDVRNTLEGRSILVHHYTPRELGDHLTASGFRDVEIQSLRAWTRSRGVHLPVRSPNPLLVVAVRT